MGFNVPSNPQGCVSNTPLLPTRPRKRQSISCPGPLAMSPSSSVLAGSSRSFPLEAVKLARTVIKIIEGPQRIFNQEIFNNYYLLDSCYSV